MFQQPAPYAPPVVGPANGGQSKPPQMQLYGGSLGNYMGQYTNPAPYQQFQASPGYASLNTGVNVTPPSLQPGALSMLMNMPSTNFQGNLGSQGGYSPEQANSLNQLYGQNLWANTMPIGTQLANAFNSQNAQNNLNLGNLQGELSQQAAGQAANNYGFNLDQQLQLSNLLRGFTGGMFGNLFGLLGNL